MKKLLLSTLVLGASTVALACPTGTTKLGTVWNGKQVCQLQGRYVNDVVLTNNYSYFLKGGVFIGNDNKMNSTLTIEPGTQIAGSSGADFLVVTRGSRILAEGTESQPIVFTTQAEQPKRGSWGGLVINGNAPINCKKAAGGYCEAEGEGSTGLYGGTDAKDSSGVLKYVRVEWAGYEITPENELNGIAFQGVGNGTIVDYIQVHMNADDGVEFFGGTVNVKHVLLTGNKDDSLDWTSGWQGKAQYVMIKQAADEGNYGIEADNLSSPMNAEPRSNPMIANATLIGSETAKKGGAGVLLRRGTGVKLYNSVITGFKQGGIDVDDAETFRNGHEYTEGLPGIHILNTILDNKVNFIVDANEEDLAAWILSGMDLDILFGSESPRVEKVSMNKNVVVSNMTAVLPLEKAGEEFFEETNYVGAVDPAGKDWTTGWSIQ
ncbi:MAG: hypothetical protein KDD61_08810 [Bdellovibrionales bacterium]|nr:hypothetical protein [Bdellovibrionales bacterium]